MPEARAPAVIRAGSQTHRNPEARAKPFSGLALPSISHAFEQPVKEMLGHGEKPGQQYRGLAFKWPIIGCIFSGETSNLHGFPPLQMELWPQHD